MKNNQNLINVDPQYLSSYPYYSRHGQDSYINEKIFKNKKNGIFIDIGAYDGVESSNTLFFEESLNWQGICLEPLPEPFCRLKENRNCLSINKCVHNNLSNAQFLHVKPNKATVPIKNGRKPNYEKLSGLTEFYSDTHQTIIKNIISEVGGETNLIDVDCININDVLSNDVLSNDVLSKTKSNTIDLLSIDTEGSELHILQSIDFSKINILVIVVEEWTGNLHISSFLKEHNYVKLKTIGYDSIYLHRSFR